MNRNQEGRRKAFVIMKFGPPYDDVFAKSIQPAFDESGYECNRGDTKLGTDNIPHQVIKDIIEADIVLADISGNSPNVFYELGVSHCINNKTLTIICTDEAVPFNISAYRAIQYRRNDAELELLKFRLIKYIEQFNIRKMSNLVQEAGKTYFDLRKKIEAKLQQLNTEISRAGKFSEFLQRDFSEIDNSEVAKKIVGHIRNAWIARNRKMLVSICGSGAVGKSTFAKLLKRNIENDLGLTVDILPTDSYMLSRADRIEKGLIGFDPKANDLKQFRQDVCSLLEGRDINVKPYSHKSGEHETEITVNPTDVIILEGIFSFYPTLKNIGGIINKPIQLKYFIYTDKYKAKELKFISDVKERGHNIYRALEHAVPEYSEYETHILPQIKLADYIIQVVGYWEYSLPD